MYEKVAPTGSVTSQRVVRLRFRMGMEQYMLQKPWFYKKIYKKI